MFYLWINEGAGEVTNEVTPRPNVFADSFSRPWHSTSFYGADASRILSVLNRYGEDGNRGYEIPARLMPRGRLIIDYQKATAALNPKRWFVIRSVLEWLHRLALRLANAVGSLFVDMLSIFPAVRILTRLLERIALYFLRLVSPLLRGAWAVIKLAGFVTDQLGRAIATPYRKIIKNIPLVRFLTPYLVFFPLTIPFLAPFFVAKYSLPGELKPFTRVTTRLHYLAFPLLIPLAIALWVILMAAALVICVVIAIALGLLAIIPVAIALLIIGVIAGLIIGVIAGVVIAAVVGFVAGLLMIGVVLISHLTYLTLRTLSRLILRFLLAAAVFLAIFAVPVIIAIIVTIIVAIIAFFVIGIPFVPLSIGGGIILGIVGLVLGFIIGLPFLIVGCIPGAIIGAIIGFILGVILNIFAAIVILAVVVLIALIIDLAVAIAIGGAIGLLVAGGLFIILAGIKLLGTFFQLIAAAVSLVIFPILAFIIVAIAVFVIVLIVTVIVAAIVSLIVTLIACVVFALIVFVIATIIGVIIVTAIVLIVVAVGVIALLLLFVPFLPLAVTQLIIVFIRAWEVERYGTFSTKTN